MNHRSTGPACGNNPNYRMSDGDRRAVEDFNAYLADRAALRDRIADVIREFPFDDFGLDDISYLLESSPDTQEWVPKLAAAVLAVLPPPADRGAVLRDAAERLLARCPALGGDDALRRCPCVAVEELRRMADETATTETTVDLPTLAAALDGIHTLIATSSRDWQTYRVDAWLWAVLCGWDCEQTEHDETCTHGALEETAAVHGWDAAAVAKARRYRAAVRTLTGARQDGAQP